MLLLNRRGWAPVLHCADCGWKSECPHCSAYRVFHKIDRTLRCHHCGFTQRVPRACPACGNLDIGTAGARHRAAGRAPGRTAGRRAPAPTARQIRIARIDADSDASGKGAAGKRAGPGARRRRGRAGRHADDRQGARLPARHPGGGDQPGRARCSPATSARPERLFSPAHAGGRPRRARRRPAAAGQRDVGADPPPDGTRCTRRSRSPRLPWRSPPSSWSSDRPGRPCRPSASAGAAARRGAHAGGGARIF
jgi:hypothetical protein